MSDDFTEEDEKEEAEILALLGIEPTAEDIARVGAMQPLVVGPGPWFDAAYDHHKCGGRAHFLCKLKHHVDAQLAEKDASIEKLVKDQSLCLRKSVEITVFRGDKILAVNSRNFDGFCGVGGKVEQGETFKEAAYRELWEETGCQPKSIEFIAGHSLDPIKGDDLSIGWYCAGFLVDIGDQEPRQNEVGTAPYWTTREDMIANSLFPRWYAWWFGILGYASLKDKG